MKKIFAIIWKDTIIRFASIYEWLFFLVLPILFTLVLAGGTGGSSDPRVLLMVVDQAQSPLSASLLTSLESSETVRSEVTDLKEAEDLFSKRRIEIGHHPTAEPEALGRILGRPARGLHHAVQGNQGTDNYLSHGSLSMSHPMTAGVDLVRGGSN